MRQVLLRQSVNKFTDFRGVGRLRTIQGRMGRGQLLLDVLGKIFVLTIICIE